MEGLLIRMNWYLVDNPSKKVAHQLGNFGMMALKGEVAAGNEMYLGIWKIALEGIGSSWNE